MTVLRSRLIKASSFWPTCISIVRFRCSALLSDDVALARCCIANLCRSRPPDIDAFECSAWLPVCDLRNSPPSNSDSGELQLTSLSAPNDDCAASEFCAADVFVLLVNASSEPLLNVLSTLALKPVFTLLVCADSSFSYMDTTLSKSAGRL